MLRSTTNNLVADFPNPITCTATQPSPMLPEPADVPAAVECIMSSPHEDQQQQQHHQVYKVFVGSWNVGGISPPDDLDLQDWLNLGNNDHSASGGEPDIYVLGFQEIVPLNAGNIIIGSSDSVVSSSSNNNNNNININSVRWNRMIGASLDEEEFGCLVSRQMVGIFLTIWVRKDLLPHITHTAVSCVGCRLMGCLGNKGSVSVRFYLEKTSFCFVCTHLASGGKQGDERYRNADAGHIISRTRFPRGHLHDLPPTILHHHRVVWLGDLNYRIYLPETTTRFLVQKQEWNVLLENDQLKAELRKGRVFDGWNEGIIQFPPTYKYCPNSGVYYGAGSLSQYCRPSPSKGRAPAWCDRIIWFGEGLKQSQYERGENKLSDHRPIRAIFTAQVDKALYLHNN